MELTALVPVKGKRPPLALTDPVSSMRPETVVVPPTANGTSTEIRPFDTWAISGPEPLQKSFEPPCVT